MLDKGVKQAKTLLELFVDHTKVSARGSHCIIERWMSAGSPLAETKSEVRHALFDGRHVDEKGN